MSFSHKWAGCAAATLLIAGTWATAQNQARQRSDEWRIQRDREDRDVGGWPERETEQRQYSGMRDREQMTASGQRSGRGVFFYRPELRKATDLIGKEVVDVKGESAGTVDDLVVDADLGMVAYVIVSRGGVLGMGERLVPVPFKSVRRTPSGILLQTEKTLLDHARAIEEDNVALLSNPREAQDIHSQFNVEPYWVSVRRAGPGEGMRSARRMQDREQFETGRDQGLYGYGQPGWDERETRSERRDQSGWYEDRRPRGQSDDRDYSEAPYPTQRRDRAQPRTERGYDDADDRYEQRPRDMDRLPERRGYVEEDDMYEVTPDQGSAMWEGELRGEPRQREVLRGEPMEHPQWRPGAANRPGTLVLASTILDEDIEDRRDEAIGELEDLMIDMNTGGIGYAVISEEGPSDTYHAVPWTVFNTRETDDRTLLVLDMSPRDIESSPGFDRDNWPDMASSRWARDIHEFYGVQPSWTYFGYVETQGRAAVEFNPQTVTTIQGTVQGMSRRGRLDAERNVVRLRVTTTGVQEQAAPGATTQPAQTGQPGAAATQPARTGTGAIKPGEQITVYLGPGSYIRQQNFSVRSGDRVTIQGSLVTIEGEPALLASRVTGTDGKTIELRNEQGAPLWSGGHRGDTGTPAEESPTNESAVEQTPDQGQSNR